MLNRDGATAKRPRAKSARPTQSKIDAVRNDWVRHISYYIPPLEGPSPLPQEPLHPSAATSLGSMPPEIFLMIADTVGMIPTIMLSLTCKSFYSLLRPSLEINARLGRAVINGDADQVKEILGLDWARKGPKVNPNGGRLLHKMIDHTWSREVASLVLRAGADINERDRNDYTPLHYAVNYMKMNVVEWFLDQPGIEVNAKTNALGWTPLHVAVYNHRHSSVMITNLLCLRGADVDAIDNTGGTPLHYAFRSGFSPKKNILLSRRANKEVYDKLGLRPSSYHFLCNRKTFREVFELAIFRFYNGDWMQKELRRPRDFSQSAPNSLFS